MNVKIFEQIGKSVGNMTRKTGLQLKKHAPEILVVTGIIEVTACVVTACKATLKVDDILTESKEKMDKVDAATKDSEMKNKYSEEDAKKDRNVIRIQTGIKIVKLYAPAAFFGIMGIASFLASNDILKKRAGAFAAAYAAADTAFKEYRSRVVERFGEEVDQELKYNVKKKTIEEEVTDENGEVHKVHKTINVVDPDTPSQYAKFFEAGSPYWEKDPELNMFFLKSKQNYFNDRLRSFRGNVIFLNEVYAELGIPKTRAGQCVGWRYDPDNPNIDNYIDFGIYRCNTANRNFVNGYEPTILLDFNVDGEVLQYLNDEDGAHVGRLKE